MSPQKLDELMNRHRSKKARLAYLRSQLEMLERYLIICKGQMVNDSVSLSQELTGMPHGTSISDPTGRLAIDIASGKVSVFVKQIQEEMEEIKEDLKNVEQEVRLVEIVLDAMNERERKLVTMKMIDELSWKEIIFKMNDEFSGGYAKRSLQRMLETAMGKAYEVVK